MTKLDCHYWRFESVEEFRSLLSPDARELIEGNSGMKTECLIDLMNKIGLENMVFEGGTWRGPLIEVINTIYIKKDRLNVDVFEFISKYRPDESDPGHIGVKEFEDRADYWRFWWD